MLQAASRSVIQFMLTRRQHLDADVLSALAMRISTALVGSASATLVLTYLSPVEQGYWYTFSSLLTVAAFAELGAGQVILRTAAREVGIILHQTDHTRALVRLKGIFAFTIKLGIWTSIVSALAVMSVGFWWLRDSAQKSPISINHNWPWILAAITSGPALFISFGNAYFEGWQYVAAANRRRLLMSWVTLAGTMVGFLSGAKLFTYGLSRGLGVAVGLYTLWVQYRAWNTRYRFENVEAEAFPWRVEVLPLQTRYALSWLSAIFGTGLFAPIIFKYAGPADAGRYGLSMSIVTILTGAATSWVSARQARMAALAGANGLRELSHLIRSIAKMSIAAYLAGACCCLVGFRLLGMFLPKFAARTLSVGEIAIALLGGLLLVIVTILQNFVRSFGVEPFVKLAWGQTALTLSLGLPAVIYCGTFGAVVTYLIGYMFAVAWAWRIAQPYIKLLHKVPPG